MVSQTQSDKDRVIIFDTTMRDGEQSPGASMTLEEKLELAKILDEMGVDVIEAGFPIASQRRLRGRAARSPRRAKNSIVCGLWRAPPKDIDRCAEAIRAGQARPHPHLHLHQSRAHEVQAADGAATRCCEAVIAPGHPGPQPVPTTWNGRPRTPPAPSRFPLPLRRGRDQGRRHHHQHPRHRRLHRAGGICRRCIAMLRESRANADKA